MRLKDLVTKIQGDEGWAVYAESSDPNADARYGQTQFKNGGLLDNKKFIINGENANKALLAYTDGDLDWFAQDGDPAEFIRWLNDEGWISEE